ncbi:MAG: hypothetical protein EXS16_11285 [Gemmataceae bacterium]|nr:hypothetical protein [Gemmataceae bacterium]
MQWHDLLGAVLIDFFADSPFDVDTEYDVTLRKQFLDIVVLRKREGEFHRPLPDGFGPLANHNLISFKSHQDAFDTWALQELVAYYVCYRKQVGGEKKKLLPATEFCLIAISARYPVGLMTAIPLVERQPGVYDIEWGKLAIRLIVIRELPLAEMNTILLLFSQATNQLDFAVRHYHKTTDDASSVIDQMIRLYKKEDDKMAITIADLKRLSHQAILEEMTPKERLEMLKQVPRRELAKQMLRVELQREPTRGEVDELLRGLKKRSAGG